MLGLRLVLPCHAVTTAHSAQGVPCIGLIAAPAHPAKQRLREAVRLRCLESLGYHMHRLAASVWRLHAVPALHWLRPCVVSCLRPCVQVQPPTKKVLSVKEFKNGLRGRTLRVAQA